MKLIVKYVLVMLILFFLWTCMGCDGSGTYTYTDAVSNTYTLRLHSNKTLELELTDYANKGDVVYDRAYGNEPIHHGQWTKQDGVTYILMSDGTDLYIVDGYLYKGLSAAREQDKRNGFKLK